MDGGVGATRARVSLHREGELIMRRTARTLFMAGMLVLPLGVAAPAQAGKAHPVPIKGTLSGTETSYPAGDWGYPGYFDTTQTEFVVDGVTYTCSEPAQELVIGTMTGNLSHLGKVTREMSYCLVWDFEDPEDVTTDVVDFTLVLTAANGDTVNLDFVSSADAVEGDGWVDYGGELAFADGTGRFVGAAGTLTETGRMMPSWYPAGWPYFAEDSSDPWTRQLSATYTGEISYDASNRAAK